MIYKYHDKLLREINGMPNHVLEPILNFDFNRYHKIHLNGRFFSSPNHFFIVYVAAMTA